MARLVSSMYVVRNSWYALTALSLYFAIPINIWSHLIRNIKKSPNYPNLSTFLMIELLLNSLLFEKSLMDIIRSCVDSKGDIFANLSKIPVPIIMDFKLES